MACSLTWGKMGVGGGKRKRSKGMDEKRSVEKKPKKISPAGNPEEPTGRTNGDDSTARAVTQGELFKTKRQTNATQLW